MGARRERSRRDEADARSLRPQARRDARSRSDGSRRSTHELEASLEYLDTCDVCDPQRLLSACDCCDLHDKEVARTRARARVPSCAAPRRTTNPKRATDGPEAPHFHGQPLDDAGRPARARGDAAVLHDEVRQRGEPQPPVRLGGGRGGRLRARADREAHRREGQRRRSSSRAARPRATTSRSRASPSSTRTRATTSSRR